MAITDLVTLILSFYFLIRGAARGFYLSLTVPASLIIATAFSIHYYKTTGDILASALIGLIGPFLLVLFFKFLLKAWTHITLTEMKPGFLSRLAGALLTLAWGWIFIFFALIIITVLPAWGDNLTALRHDVTKSASYLIIKPYEKMFFAGSIKNTPAKSNESSLNDARNLANDPRFQKVLQDPDIQAEMNTHDYSKLMSNPKMITLIQEIMSDPATMKKVFSLYKSQGQSSLNPNE